MWEFIRHHNIDQRKRFYVTRFVPSTRCAYDPDPIIAREYLTVYVDRNHSFGIIFLLVVPLAIVKIPRYFSGGFRSGVFRLDRFFPRSQINRTLWNENGATGRVRIRLGENTRRARVTGEGRKNTAVPSEFVRGEKLITIVVRIVVRVCDFVRRKSGPVGLRNNYSRFVCPRRDHRGNSKLITHVFNGIVV